MNIAGVIKDWMLIFFSFYLFHAPVSRLNLAGYAFCCTGVAVYNWQKLQVGAGCLECVVVMGWVAVAVGHAWPVQGRQLSLHHLNTPAPASTPRNPAQALKRKAQQKHKDGGSAGPAEARPLLAAGAAGGKTEGSKA